MDVIWSILVVIGIIVTIVGKSKGAKPANKPGAGARPAAQPKAQAWAAPKPVAAPAEPVVSPRPAVDDISGIGLSKETAELLRKLERAEERQARYEEGAGMGSLQGTEAARVERTDATPRGRGEHTPEKPIEALRRYDPACEECGTPYADAQHMREAVVMAEILNKPVSLRGRRSYR